MRRFGIVASLLVTLMATHALAQAPAVEKKAETKPAPVKIRNGMGNATVERLLIMPAVQKEIKLTAEQEKQAKSQNAKTDEYYRQEGKQYLDMIKQLGENPDPEQVQAIRQQRVLALKTSRDEADRSLLKILSGPQRARLLEIRMQLEGASAFFRLDVQDRLNLSPDQREEIRNSLINASQSLRQNSDREQEEIRQRLVRITDAPKNQQASSGEQENIRVRVDPAKEKGLEEARKNLAKEADATQTGLAQEIERVLTKRQRDTYRKMLGKKFDPNPPAVPSNNSDAAEK